MGVLDEKNKNVWDFMGVLKYNREINLRSYSFKTVGESTGVVSEEVVEPSEEITCVTLTEKECRQLNSKRDLETLETKTIEVGLELPNSEGKLIRFIPRYVTFVTRE